MTGNQYFFYTRNADSPNMHAHVCGFDTELGQLPTVQFLYCSTRSSLWCPRQRRQWLRWASNFANWPRMQIGACTLRETYICTRSVTFNEEKSVRSTCGTTMTGGSSSMLVFHSFSCCLRKWIWTYLTLHCGMPTIKFADFHLERDTSTEDLKTPSISFQPSLYFFAHRMTAHTHTHG